MIATLSSILGTMALLNPYCAAQDKIDQARKTTRDDRQEIIRRLTADYELARSQLEKKNPGEGTRALQRKIIEGLDKLLDPPDDARPPQSPSPVGADPARKPTNSAPGQSTSTTVAPQKTTGAEAIAKKPSTSANEVQAQGDGWRVTLPPRRLPDTDAFARERIVPRYEELLRAYHRRIAESARHREREE